MDIIFADKNLKKYADNINLSVRKLGAKRAGLFHQRLEDMAASDSFADLEHLPGRFHSLTQNRKGQWACDLDHPYRLIFEPAEEPLPRDKQGNLMLTEIKIVEIIEIKDYH